MPTDRNGYDSGASSDTQGAITSLSGQIETLIAQHRSNVRAMRTDATMTQVMDDYGAVEEKFNAAATEVQSIIKSLSETLKQFDGVADTAFTQAKQAVNNIGNT